MTLTFENWLLKQKKRNDPIGDLANDFEYSKKIKNRQGYRRIKCNKKHLNEYSACPGAYDALLNAYKEFRDIAKDICKEDFYTRLIGRRVKIYMPS